MTAQGVRVRNVFPASTAGGYDMNLKGFYYRYFAGGRSRLAAWALVAVVAIVLGYEVWHWGFCRVYVGPDEALLVINKFGDPLPPDRIVVPAGEDRYKGVQADLRGPGRYF